MRERPILFSGAMVRAILSGQKTVTRRAVKSLEPGCRYQGIEPDGMHLFTKGPACGKVKCPYGQPGDRLWVREAWSTHACFDSVAPRNLTTRSIAYLADGQIKTGKYRPPMFMPRWACRILLEITDVRVERLQEITEQQALTEGVASCAQDLDPDGNGYSPGELFSILWSSINGTDSWNANPWVWVVEFKRVEVANV